MLYIHLRLQFYSDSVFHYKEGIFFRFGGNSFYVLEKDTFLNINKALTNKSTKAFDKEAELIYITIFSGKHPCSLRGN